MNPVSRVGLPTWDPRLADVAMAGLLAAVAVVEVSVGDDLGSRPVVVVAALVVTMSVGLRRRFPLTVLGLALAVVLAQALAGSSLSQSVTPFVALLILIYSVGSHRAGLAAVVGLGIALAGLWAMARAETWRGGFDHEAADYVFVGLLAGAAWLVGYALRGRARRIAGLEDETIRLAREREERARAAVAEERARIARDLHDVVAHNVSVMVVQAAAAEEVLDLDPERVRAPLTAIQETGAQALIEMRRLLGILRSDDAEFAITRQPGLAGLDTLATEFRAAGLPLELAIQDGRPALSSGVDLAAYRILEEALTNALKHNGGAPTKVSVRHSDGAIQLEVTDTGVNAPSGNGAGHGLIGMRERAALYGGTLEAGPQEGGGFAVRAKLPFDATTGPGGRT